jgi:hypothetical protein
MIIGVILVIIIFGFLGWLLLAMIKKEKKVTLVMVILLITSILSIILVYGSFYASTSDDMLKLKINYEKVTGDLRYYARDYDGSIFISSNDNQVIFDCSRLNKDDRKVKCFSELYKRTLDYNAALYEEKSIRGKNIFIILWYGLRYSIPAEIKEIKIIL